MKAINIRFFSPQDNQVPEPKKGKITTPKKVILTGYISASGRLIFPVKTMGQLGVDVENTSFKIGMAAGKRKAKSLYMVKADGNQDDTFRLEKAAKSYSLPLAVILKKSGVDFTQSKYSFTIKLFDYQGSTALELQLHQDEATPKAVYTGKPRGRRTKTKGVDV